MKTPTKLIDKAREEIIAALSGEENDFDSLRVRDSYDLLSLLNALKDDVRFALDIYVQIDKNVVLEYLDDKIIMFLQENMDRVIKEILLEQAKLKEGGASNGTN